jgi:hypothetical protein
MRSSALAPAMALALSVTASGCGAASEPPAPRQTAQPTLGLLSSLPIYWGVAADFGAALKTDADPGWVRAALEERYALRPLDTLDEESLRGLAIVLLAQPRPLSPEENVALDKWVRGGGRLLLFADPMLTAHSDYPLGDRRRPQDVVLLSPILRHWALELRLDNDQPGGERTVGSGNDAVPVEMAGHFEHLPGGACTLSLEAVLAECGLGKGRVTILADAAVLDGEGDPDFLSHRAALHALASRAFD